MKSINIGPITSLEDLNIGDLLHHRGDTYEIIEVEPGGDEPNCVIRRLIPGTLGAGGEFWYDAVDVIDTLKLILTSNNRKYKIGISTILLARCFGLEDELNKLLVEVDL